MTNVICKTSHLNCLPNKFNWCINFHTQLCRELTQNSQLVRNKNRENTRQRKIIICTRQYLHGSAICLCPRSCRDFTIIREKYKVRQYSVSCISKTITTNPNHHNCVFYILRIGFTMGYKMGQKNFPKGVALGPPKGLSMSTMA